MKLLHGDMIHD